MTRFSAAGSKMTPEPITKVKMLYLRAVTIGSISTTSKITRAMFSCLSQILHLLCPQLWGFHSGRLIFITKLLGEYLKLWKKLMNGPTM